MSANPQRVLQEQRCNEMVVKQGRMQQCNGLLFKGEFHGTVEVKCNNCKKVQVIEKKRTAA